MAARKQPQTPALLPGERAWLVPDPVRPSSGQGESGAPTVNHADSMAGRPVVWFLLAALFLAVAIGWLTLPVRQWVEAFDATIVSLGIWGTVLFALVYVVAVVLLAPAEILSIAAGFLFGAWGFPLVISAATLGAALAFLISRYAVRSSLQRVLRNHPRYAAIDRAVAEEGW